MINIVGVLEVVMDNIHARQMVCLSHRLLGPGLIPFFETEGLGFVFVCSDQASGIYFVFLIVQSNPMHTDLLVDISSE